MEVAVRNSIFIRLKLLSELNDRECIVRIGKMGRMLSAFKGKTLDFVSVPRKKSSLKKNDIIKTKEDKPKKKFDINTKSTLKDMMSKQSTSRKRVNLEKG